MNIGDKVRLVHGKEEGIIYAFLPGNVVEVEIEDGFRIPVLQKELVTISPIEAQRMSNPKAPGIAARKETDHLFQAPAAFATKGLYLAFIPVNDRVYTLHVVNNSGWVIPFTATSQDTKQYKGLGAGTLMPKTSQKIAELEGKDFEIWPAFDLHFLFYREGNYELPQPLNKKVKCRAQTFFKSKKVAPVLNREAFVIQLDADNVKTPEKEIPTNLSEKLRESMMAGGTPEEVVELDAPNEIVDLHIEKLVAEHSALSKEEKLKHQLFIFNQSLEQAIAGGMPEITFIHGVGNGKLREEIHRQLSKNKDINYFKDAQKEKFGYGATLVKII
jgi:hypothetical protein